MKKGIELFYSCGCADGSLYGGTENCIYCKGTGKLLTEAGKYLIQIVEYHEQQKQFDARKEDDQLEKIHEDALNDAYSWGNY